MNPSADLAAMCVPSDARAVGSLFPEEVISVTATRAMECASLLPEEEAYIQGAVLKRRREFILGRACARAALARLGIRDHPLTKDRNRAPVWPAGVVGSISHCDGFCGAAVASRGPTILGVGLDAEPAEPFPPGVVTRVCTPGEIERAPANVGRIDWHRLIFSAKESVYKACYPLVKRVLEFSDVEITIEPTERSFAVRAAAPLLATELKGKRLLGRFAVTDTHMFTGVTVVQAGDQV